MCSSRYNATTTGLVLRVSEAYEVMAEHLGYSVDEMRAVQGNFQRTMHDLNSLVHFSDLARRYISEHRDNLPELGSGVLGEIPGISFISHTPTTSHAGLKTGGPSACRRGMEERAAG